MSNTLLVITGIGIPQWSARGLTQTLEPVEESVHLEYDLNGRLRDLSQPQFRKYRSTITCRDIRIPAIDGIWPGAEVTVDCVAELIRPVAQAASRTVVPGSEITEGSFVRYRPRLIMLVVRCPISKEEFQAYNGWSIELLEK